MAIRGRPLSSKTLVDRQLGRNIKHPILPANDFVIPNHSGEHDAGTTGTPTSDRSLVNKEYVDDKFIGGSGSANYVAVWTGSGAIGYHPLFPLYVNSLDRHLGINTATPQTTLHVVGDCRFGNQATNYCSFATDGELNLEGTARVTRHLRVGASSWEHGASPPTQGFDGVFVYEAFDSATDDEVYYTLIIPSRWDISTDIEFVVDWYYTGDQDNGTVTWKLEYRSMKGGEEVTGTTTTISKTSVGRHTAGEMVRTTFTTKILATNLQAKDTIGLKLSRDVSKDTLATDARLLNTHFHFIQNKLGEAT